MESRKRWRKGEPGTRERVTAVLDALRDGIGAEGIGLFDDDRAEGGPAGHHSPVNFWDAFVELDLPCVDVDWPTWYEELKAEKRVESACACGAHRLRGFVIHDRWALLVLTPAALAPGAALAISSATQALAAHLPPLRIRTDAAIAHPARDGAPLWWVRKTRQ